METLTQYGNFLDMCEATGFCDAYYKGKTHDSKAPTWMRDSEISAWHQGVSRGLNLLNSKR